MSVTPPDEPFVDPILGALYSVTTQAGEFGVSLLLGGSWVTGMAISGRAWCTQLAKWCDDSADGGNSGDIFRHLGQQTFPSDAEVEAGVSPATEEMRMTRFIHLRDARFVGVHGAPEDGAFVRCRLDKVEAWILGNIGPAGYRPPPPAI